jgi:hypothetical protein
MNVIDTTSGLMLVLRNVCASRSRLDSWTTVHFCRLSLSKIACVHNHVLVRYVPVGPHKRDHSQRMGDHTLLTKRHLLVKTLRAYGVPKRPSAFSLTFLIADPTDSNTRTHSSRRVENDNPCAPARLRIKEGTMKETAGGLLG